MHRTPPAITLGVTRSIGSVASAHGSILETNNRIQLLPGGGAIDTDVLLDRYQRLMAPHMPYVVIPIGTNASSMAVNKPFLLQAVETVAFFHDTAIQQSMVKDLMRQISERVMINGGKSLDLVQGRLVFGNWYNPHLFAPPSHTVLLHLTMALAHDLDINRASGFCEKTALMAASQASTWRTTTGENRNERRATRSVWNVVFDFTDFHIFPEDRHPAFVSLAHAMC